LFAAALRETAEDPSVIVKVVCVTLRLGVNVGGLKEAVAPAGRPEIVNNTELGNPFAVGVAVI
jgi:hypothetical protein